MFWSLSLVVSLSLLLFVGCGGSLVNAYASQPPRGKLAFRIHV
jgi:hypothetical protein